MATPKLGSKQLCPKCDKPFYDLERRPAVCPKCTHSFDPDAPPPPSRSAARAKPAAKKEEPAKPEKAAEDGDGFQDEPETVAEIDAEGAVAVAPGNGDDDSEEDETAAADDIDELPDGFSDDDGKADGEQFADDDAGDPKTVLGVTPAKEAE